MVKPETGQTFNATSKVEMYIENMDEKSAVGVISRRNSEENIIDNTDYTQITMSKNHG